MWYRVESELRSFQSLQGGLLVAPVLSELILNREPDAVLRWVQDICKWDFQRIIPCHLENDIAADKEDFSRAFEFLRRASTDRISVKNSYSFRAWLDGIVSSFSQQSSISIQSPKPTDEDLSLLRKASALLTQLGVVAPPAVASSTRQ